MAGPTPEAAFESRARLRDGARDLLPQAIENYRQVLDLAPDWIDAHINLGVALYQMGRLDEARAEFLSAVQLDPLNGISRYNLGCVLEEQGEIEEAIEHLRRAARAMPAHADVHFNLALAYEKRGERRLAREHWLLLSALRPQRPLGRQARAHLRRFSGRPQTPPQFPSPQSLAIAGCAGANRPGSR